MSTFTGKKFSATLDSKGRVTVPASMRKSLNIEQGDELTLALPDTEIQQYSVSSKEEALELLEELEDVEEFNFSGNTLEVVVNG